MQHTVAGGTGNGHLLYVHVSTASPNTGILAIATAGSLLATPGRPFGTAIVPLGTYDFGSSTSQLSNFVAWSGANVSATKTIGKVQNVSINITYENAQMRGGGDVFPFDTQFFDGAVEGSFDLADPTAQHGLFFGGTYVSGGTSGTWTLSGQSVPINFALRFQNTTDGVTSTYLIRKAYLMSQTNDFSRTEFLNPSYNFIGQQNFLGDVIQIQG